MTSRAVGRSTDNDGRRIAYVLMGLAMAIEAPPHREWLRLHHSRHRCDIAVAVHALNTSSSVNPVMKVDEVGEIVNSIPGDRLPREP